MLRKLLVFLAQYTWITVAVLIGAFAVAVFYVPAQIVPGGVSGLAIILNHWLGTPIGLMTFLLNVPILYLAYRMLPGRWHTVFRTLYVVAVFSVALDFINLYLKVPPITDDRLLNAVFGAVLGGISGGMILRAGATAGGTGTLARIIQYRFGNSLSSVYLLTDTAVILLGGLTFGLESALYAMLALFIGGIAADYVLEGPSVVRTAVIVTNQPQEVSAALIGAFERSVTGWGVTGMYTGQERWMLYMTIPRSQVNKLRGTVAEIDHDAFVVIGQGHRAFGKGFRTIDVGLMEQN
jgi:uncharacterized membrane-anchored protein YitT (DUF2179 family)